MSLNEFGKAFLAKYNQQKTIQKKVETPNPFMYATATEWIKRAKNKPEQKQLLGDLWYENELCILFAKSNGGKSIFSVQIADAIAQGTSIAPFENQSAPKPVLYFDFELTERQFAKRCINSENPEQYYPFNENFVRFQYESIGFPDQYKNETEFVLALIDHIVEESGAKVLVLDNITFLNPDSSDAKRTADFIKTLKTMKNRHGLSILLIGHTTKMVDFEPLFSGHLYGSSMMYNFIDSCFGIGVGRNEVRYVKQFKTRNGELIYGSSNLPSYEIDTVKNLVMFKFKGFSSEHSLLAESNEVSVDKIEELYDNGMSGYKIAKELGIGKTTAYKYIKSIEKQRQLRAAQEAEDKANEEEHIAEWQGFIDGVKKQD